MYTHSRPDTPKDGHLWLFRGLMQPFSMVTSDSSSRRGSGHDLASFPGFYRLQYEKREAIKSWEDKPGNEASYDLLYLCISRFSKLFATLAPGGTVDIMRNV